MPPRLSFPNQSRASRAPSTHHWPIARVESPRTRPPIDGDASSAASCAGQSQRGGRDEAATHVIARRGQEPRPSQSPAVVAPLPIGRTHRRLRAAALRAKTDRCACACATERVPPAPPWPDPFMRCSQGPCARTPLGLRDSRSPTPRESPTKKTGTAFSRARRGAPWRARTRRRCATAPGADHEPNIARPPRVVRLHVPANQHTSAPSRADAAQTYPQAAGPRGAGAATGGGTGGSRARPIAARARPCHQNHRAGQHGRARAG